jgi:glycosyltransferase involved in cell wall biosynthesis
MGNSVKLTGHESETETSSAGRVPAAQGQTALTGAEIGSAHANIRTGVPRVSLAVPVYNGEKFLPQTLDSLLNQTFTDFELIISDNASTDRTEEICRAYAARDPRIRYYRNTVNRGAAWNHNYLFGLAKGEYFKWNASDDTCAPEFLAECVAALDRDPSAVMAMTEPLEMDQDGKPLESVSIPDQTLIPAVPEGAPTHIRFRQNIRLDHLCMTIFSVFRSDVLRRTALEGNYPDADRVLLAHLALFGSCVVVPKKMFFNRDHPDRFSRSTGGYYSQWRARAVWWDPKNTNRLLFPFWEELFEFVRVVRQSPLAWRDRMRCYREVIAWMGQEGHMRCLYRDATYYPRTWIVAKFPWAKAARNSLRRRVAPKA